LLRDQQFSLSDSDFDRIMQLSEGYSGADIKVLCSEASMGPIRDLVDILNASKSQVRSINMTDFERALRSVRASVVIICCSFLPCKSLLKAPSEITAYLDWNNMFGTVKGN
jgi:SpoVK/Ycf46/Vps4 family AAA+-type ATPase